MNQEVFQVLQNAVSVNKQVNNTDLEQLDNLALDMKENEEQANKMNQMFAAEGDESQLLKELEGLELGEKQDVAGG